MLMDPEDIKEPPGFAVVAHHKPHQLFAVLDRLLCWSVRAELNRLQLLAHAY